MRIGRITEGRGIYNLSNEDQLVKQTLTNSLFILEDAIRKKGTQHALHDFLKMVLVHPQFDFVMVRFLRRMVANFMGSNGNLLINGLPLEEVVRGEHESTDSFIKEIVLKDKEEALSGIHVVIPLVLRISLIYVVLDASDSTIV